jgi:hypothetical protein
MADQKKTPPTVTQNVSGDNNIVVGGDVSGVVVVGNENTVNQTIIQKFFNIFKSDSETLEQRNRRILLGHVENAWIKGVLDASLHGAAMLDLGIKQDPEAVTKYPWAIKKESTDETLPAGTSMLDIFDSIGMGRSLLILGAPGSGKTTMLLELARQLIARAREDVTYPIPMVFNLASWTEKLTLADWLAQELNNLYSVPRKTAPDWVKGDKLLLLLDGLDEVRQESRAKCVEAINAFRKAHGLTSLAVCSRSQDYADLNAKLSFEGAIEVQPLTQKQIAEFFTRFGKEMAGIKQVLKKDSALREMAETPLFLSIMIMAYRDKRDVEILTSQDENAQRKHLFDTYIERMFERRSENATLKKQNVLHWLSWLSRKMIEHNQEPYFIENMQPNWLKILISSHSIKNITAIMIICSIWFLGLVVWLAASGQIIERIGHSLDLLFHISFRETSYQMITSIIRIVDVIICIILSMLLPKQINEEEGEESEVNIMDLFGIKMVDRLVWSWRKAFTISRKFTKILLQVATFFIFVAILILEMSLDYLGLDDEQIYSQIYSILLPNLRFLAMLIPVLSMWLVVNVFLSAFNVQEIDQTTIAEQRLWFSAKNSLFVTILLVLMLDLVIYTGFISIGVSPNEKWLIRFFFYTSPTLIALSFLIVGLKFGGIAIILHYFLRLFLARNNLLPWRLVPFLDHCVDLIFLRRVGGGYIFVHRLLMEHFAEMYVEKGQ